METAEFSRLVGRLAEAWEAHDTDAALSCFAPEAVYMEPPDVQLFVGHDELRGYFDALLPGTVMDLAHVWFDERSQVGAAEYRFGSATAETADHGVAVIEVSRGRIAFWREYQRSGDTRREAFLATDGKEWEWHGGNYP